jgi:hypothetical protein
MSPHASSAPRLAWQRLAHMQHVVSTRPDVAFAVRCLTLLDQLELTLELLNDCLEFDSDLPPNVIRFPTRQRS